MMTTLSLAISYPTLAAAPHMIVNAYKNFLCVSLETEYTYPQAQQVKEYLKDPKFAVATVVVAESATTSQGIVETEDTKKEEEAESEEDDAMFGLFDD
ncbi:hypothetical protein KY285_037120 [Solanum tuberosum]|nr:hypothetical protein KY285_037120 [Solanum tuberosum]